MDSTLAIQQQRKEATSCLKLDWTSGRKLNALNLKAICKTITSTRQHRGYYLFNQVIFISQLPLLPPSQVYNVDCRLLQKNYAISSMPSPKCDDRFDRSTSKMLQFQSKVLEATILDHGLTFDNPKSSTTSDTNGAGRESLGRL